MKIKRLKELIKDLPDDTEIYIRNSFNICGTIGDLEQVEKGFYSFFGHPFPCIILNTQHTQKKLEETGLDDPYFFDYVESDENGELIKKGK